MSFIETTFAFYLSARDQKQHAGKRYAPVVEDNKVTCSFKADVGDIYAVLERSGEHYFAIFRSGIHYSESGDCNFELEIDARQHASEEEALCACLRTLSTDHYCD